MCIFFSSPRSFFILRSILIDLHRPSSPSLFFFSNRFVREFHFDLREFTLRYPSKNFCRKYFTTPFQPSKWITNAERANSNVFRDVWSIPKLTFILHPPFYGWQKSLWKQFDSREYLLFLPSFDLSASIIRLRIIVLRISRFSRIHLGLASSFSFGGVKEELIKCFVSRFHRSRANNFKY